MSLFKSLPPSGSVVSEGPFLNAGHGVMEPSWAVQFGHKALTLGIAVNSYARKASLDKRGSTGRTVAVVHLDDAGRVVRPPKPDFSDLGEQAERSVHLAKRRTSYITRTNDLAVAVARTLRHTRRWSNGDPVTDEEAGQLEAWTTKLAGCSRYIEVWSCRCCGTTRTKSNCCACPPCPREQRRRSGKWVSRAMRLYDQLQDTPIFRWRLVTMSLRKTGDIARDVEATLKMRAGLMRLLRSKFGMGAGFGAVEQGDDNNIHLHALVYCRYVERAKLQSWLRSRDCTIRGCKHPADDRCEACISAKTACAHPDGVRVRCDGSWVVNVQMVRGRKGVQEAIKYAAAPVALHDLPTEGMPASPVQLAHAERLLRFYLTMQDRHRVETYGAAKEDVEPDEADDLPLDGEMRPCSQGRPLEFVAFGVNQDVGYVWFRTQFGSA